MTWFDPKSPEIALRQAALLRKRAEALRASGEKQPQGQMVSGHFVAPHWSQQLLPIVDQLMASYYDRRANRYEDDAQQAMERQTSDWIAGVPQPTQRQVPFQAPGIDEADAAAASAGAYSVQTVQPTRAQILKHAIEGMKNPMTRELASAYVKDQLIQAPVREQEREFRSQEAQADREARMEQHRAQLEQRAEDLRLRLEDRNLDRTSREEMARQLRDLQDEMNRRDNETRRETARILADVRREAAANRPSKPISTTVMKDLSSLRNQVEMLKHVASQFKDEYGGLIAGGIAGTIGGYLPKSVGGDRYREATDWWKAYENLVALVERHEKFGATLSSKEQAAWTRATIGPGMSSDTIRKNLAIRLAIAISVYNRAVEQYDAAGHEASKAFPRLESNQDDKDLPRPKTPAEAQALPPGTRFIDPNGELRVR